MPASTAKMKANSDAPVKRSKVKEAPKETIPVYDPDLPEPTSRADLLKHWINLSYDDKTANKKLWITEGGARVDRKTDELTCPILDTPVRYDHAPQVLCKEGVEGFRAYWEVDITGWVVVGVATEDAPRRCQDGACGLGENDRSVGMGWAGSYFQVWFDAVNKDIRDVPNCNHLAVYMDQPAGVLCFYTVREDEDTGKKEVHLLQKTKFSVQKKILPAFWLGNKSSCFILKKDE